MAALMKEARPYRARRGNSREVLSGPCIEELLDDSSIEDLSDDSDCSDFDLTLLNGTCNSTHDRRPTCSSDSDEPDEDDLPLIVHTGRRMIWKHCDEFDPLPPAPPFISEDITLEKKEHFQYFTTYLPEDFFVNTAFCTNARYFKDTGKMLMLTGNEVKTFFGISLAISTLGFPRLRMYWARRTRIPLVADNITRNRFFLIRNNLKVVVDDDVSQETKTNDRFWKVSPLISHIRSACLATTRSPLVSIDEQMVPFWGKSRMRQYVRGKPNPCGIKNIVMTTPLGLPLDFFFYEGKGATVSSDEESKSLDIGGKMVVRLTNTLPVGCTIYIDRYFTSLPLLDLLFSRGLTATGTIMKSRNPCLTTFMSDGELRKRGRGACDQLVRSDSIVSAVKWLDSKPVHLISTKEGVKPTDKCLRWSKGMGEQIEIERPAIVKQYNTNMGGVDFLDRVIAYYRMGARTKKWTVRVIHHLVDFAVASAWIAYRSDEKELGTPKRDIDEFFDFRMAIAESLIYSKLNVSESGNDTIASEEENTDPCCTRKRRKVTPHPPNALRKCNIGHLPEIKPGRPSRCRAAGCNSNGARFFCPQCKVYLCITSKRNCYKMYHTE